MPSTKDLKGTADASFLIIGDSGTHKTFFLGTCPKPAYIFDFDKGVSILSGVNGVDYDTFKDAPKGVKPAAGGALGTYEWGTAWPAFIKRLNEIGASIDKGDCQYKTLAFDSLTMMSDIAMNYILKQNNREKMEIQDWGAYLSNMSNLFNQFTGWPGVKVVIAHVKRMENDLTKLEEKLPLVQGQFAGKVSIYFDEVYYTEVKSEGAGANKKLKWTLVTQPTSIIRQAKSRRFNLPDGTEASYDAIRPYVEGKK